MQASKYEKSKIVNSKKFSGVERDLLEALLVDTKKYTIDECMKLLKKEQRRVIK